MFDARLRKHIDPLLNRLGAKLAKTGLSPNVITLIGLFIGLAASAAVAFGWFSTALILVLLSRVFDGLDGAVARATQKTDFGGYLDIWCDFFFYGALPFGFILFNPEQNALSGALLLLSFYVNGASFLGFAILAEKRAMKTDAQGEKTLYYSNGLLEGAETITFFLLICLIPHLFSQLAFVFAGLCFATAILRVYGVFKLMSSLSQNEVRDEK